MKTDEMTSFETEKEVKVEIKQSSKQPKKNGWQKVTIGGVTGILMGAAGMYAANAINSESEKGESKDEPISDHPQSHEGENGLKVAEVNDSMSFGEAFAAARNAVGAGGVFHWRGNIYNTFTEEEWNNMSPQEKAQFAQQVQPELRSEEMHSHETHHDSHPDTAQHHRDSHDETEQKDDARHDEEPSKNDETKDNTHEQDNDEEPEVHFLGVEQRETDDGNVVNIGHMTINQDEVAVVDIDNDQVFDVAISDANRNGEIEESEVKDISDAGLTVTDFALMAAAENGDVSTGEPEVVVNQQDQIAEDMPDYVSDADMQSV